VTATLPDVAPTNPIVVRRARRIWDRSRVTYFWECQLCGRRAYHRSDRFSDRLREARGKAPDRHARERAIEGGLKHLHRKRTPCSCCSTANHDRFTSRRADSRFTQPGGNS
jgi:hypothetical protein